MLKLSKKLRLGQEAIDSPNLCSRFSDEDLTKIGACVVDGYKLDKQSRAKWEKRNEAGMDLALQIQKAKNFPWPGCSNVAFPLVTIAAMQFHARAYPTIIQGTDLVKCRVVGYDPTGEVHNRADRISIHMSWQVTEEDRGWEEQHDTGLLNEAIVGCNFYKTYYNASEGHNVSELVLAKDFVINYYAKSCETAGRKTQLIPLFRNDVYEKVRRGTYRNVLEETWFVSLPQLAQRDQQRVEQDNRQGVIPPSVADETTPFIGLEQHVNLDLDDDGYAEPYIVTVEKENQAVLRIVCGFDREEDIERTSDGKIIKIRAMQYYTKYGFIPSPDGGLYDVGFGVLLGPLNESVNTAINQIFDAGTWSATAGGFLGRGAKIRGGVHSFSPYEWKRVDAQGDDLRKNILPLEVREPSAVLFNLLSLLINYTNRISGATDMMVGENPGQNTPAETSRTMVEMGQKIYNSIFKRVWRSMKEEFKKLYVLNAIYLPDISPFGPTGQKALREDYLGNPDDVAPAADPNLSSETERLNQATALKSAAMATPGYDPAKVEKLYLRAIGLDPATIEEVYPGVEAFPPGEDIKLQIAKLNAQVKMEEAQGKLQLEAARLQLDAREMDLKAQELQIEIQLKLVELEGDVEDREVQRMNAMVSMMKSQADQFRARADLIISHLEASRAGQEYQREDEDRALTVRDSDRKFAVDLKKLSQGDKKLEQGEKKLKIDEKKANQPKPKAKA